MAITAEWILNKAKQKIYAISHAKAVVRGNSTVDADMNALEKSVSELENSLSSIKTTVEGMELDEIQQHLTEQLNSEAGAHGIRYYNSELQFYNGTEWVTIETGSYGTPPRDMKSVSVTYGLDGTKLVLKGSDPDDTVVDGETLSKWAGTKIVRKVGSYPKKVTDGVLVVDYQTRDQYKTNGFIDTGLVEGETYYYRWFPYSEDGAVNNTTKESVNRASLAPKNYKVVGVTADWANNTYTRTGDAAGISLGVTHSLFDNYPMFSKRRRCIVTDDKKILAFHGETGYTETGKTTQSITKNGVTYPSGTSVQVMVYQPSFYYKVTPITYSANPNGTGYIVRKATYEVSEVQYEGFKIHPNFVRNNKVLPYMLHSAFECTVQNSSGTYITAGGAFTTGSDKLASIAGAKPITGSSTTFTRSVARTLASRRGSGWQIGDMLTAACSQLLFLIEYATMDSQTAIGRGNVDNTGNYADGVIVTGGTSSLGNKSGQAAGGTSGKCCVTYRGEENLWGNVWTWQDGGNAYDNNTGILYWSDHGFADDTSDSPYQSSGFNFARSNGYVSAFGYSPECDFMFIAAECSGDSANPVGDYFYQYYSYSGMTVAVLGGRCADGSAAGLFCWRVGNASSSSNWVIGSRLVCVPDEDAEAA